ncbi:hypothetical protein, partial [Leptotrichia sp. OH3620_COT-345]|uniref:hypothetical protein n=1 Tax=Leptotrichia sp. OH3620_COT-345 TaxID=2491048 RepID=UPI0013159D7B
LPKLVSEEEKAKYNENPSKWLKENNYSMPITSSDLAKIRGNYKAELKENVDLSDVKIMKKWLNDGHGAYTYYSAIYAGEIDKLLKNYVKANGVERLGIESEIERKYIENQEKLIELFTNGPAILNDSQGLREGVTEYNRRDFEKEYNQGRYIDKGLLSNYLMNSMNESIRKGKLGVLEIDDYIKSLRNGAGLR